MSAHIINGKLLAEKFLHELSLEVKAFLPKAPTLATILVGDNMASGVYVANKRKKALEVGIKSIHYELEANISEEELLKLIYKLNQEPIDGILVQLPLPRHINENTIIDAIDPRKDVDGFHPLNLGYLFRGTPKVVACTPLGILEIIKSVNYDLSGQHAVVIGRSNIVGKPAAALLLANDATVSICHALTKNLSQITKEADLIVAAIGQPKFIDRSYIKKGAFVIDVGINRDHNNKICGDVDFLDVLDIAGYITPVPGGVGPLTIAMLLKNTFSNFLRGL
jgi:methylenetetrahydrofolate dehydrogenase (NADP+)/methenyltetrahydrofolate cyclohydrolase